MLPLRQKEHDKLPPFLRSPDPSLYVTSNNYLVLDFETTNLDKGDPTNPDNRLLLACWWYNDKLYSHFGSEFEQKLLSKHIEEAEFIVAHNTKFELGWLKRMGVDQAALLPWCTLLAEYVRWSNLRKPLDLGNCLKRYGLSGKHDLVGGLIKAGVPPENIPTSLLETYCKIDVMQTHKLFLAQRNFYRDDRRLAVCFTRNITTPVLVEMEFHGMQLDEERVKHVHQALTQRKQALETSLHNLIGDVNLNSSPQRSELLYETLKFKVPKDWYGRPMQTPKGAKKTDDAAIKALDAKTKKQKQFKEWYLELASITGIQRSAEKMLACCEEAGGVLRFNFNQSRTATQRLSSNGKKFKLQGQNFPRVFKPLFKARDPDYEVGEIDQGKLEYVIAVHLGKDGIGLRDILDGVDSHGVTASIIFKDTYQQGKKEDKEIVRTMAKAHTFKPLFGGSSGTPEQQEYYEFFKKKHKGITSAQERWKEEAYRTKQVETEWGLIFYFPNTRYTRSGYQTDSTNICNYPIQSFATAEIVPICVVYLFHYLRLLRLKSFLVNTIHDSAIAEIFKPERELFHDIAVYTFTNVPTWYVKEVYGIELFAPLSAEFKTNEHWNDSEYWQNQWLN